MKIRSLIFCGILFLMVFFTFLPKVFCITVHDFLVNPEGLEDIPHFYAEIAFDQDRNFVVAWVDRGLEHNYRQVYFQRFDSCANRIGAPVLVSDSTITSNGCPDIAMSPSGSFVICWNARTGGGPYNNRDIWAQGFDSSGEPAWLRQQVNEVRPVPYYNEGHPSIAIDNEDNFVVVWQTEDPEGRNVYAQRFDASGEKLGNNLLVSDVNASNYDLCDWLTLYPDVAFNSEGYFFTCWLGCVMCPGSPITPLARVYNPAGEPATLVFPFFAPCSSLFDYGSYPGVASNSQNNFVVVFNGNDTLWTYPNNAVYVQTFDTLGTPLDSVKIVNDVIDLGDIWHRPRIAVDSSDDGYIVLWSDWRTITDCNLWAQRFNSSGEPVGQNYRINLPPGSLSSSDGQYANWELYSLAIHTNTVGFAWVDYRNWEVYNTDVYAKLLDLDAIGFYLLGDVVMDGIVNLSDLIYLINYLYRGGPGPLPQWVGDVTSDGEINIGDLVFLINYLFRDGPPPLQGDLR